MMELFTTSVTAAAAIGSGVAGGVYFAFSTIVSPALRLRPASEAVTAMQRVNENAVRAPFMIVFFGGTLAACAAAATATISGAAPEAVPLRVIGAGLTLASVATTILFNVPRNNALARAKPSDPDAADVWRSFDAGWSPANTIRAALAIAGAVFLAASMVTVSRP